MTKLLQIPATVVGTTADRRRLNGLNERSDAVRLPTYLRENAETRKLAREQAGDPIRKGDVDLRQPSLARTHHEDA